MRNLTTPTAGGAASPSEMSSGRWRDVLAKTTRAMIGQEMSMAAAAISFYAVWAFFPALVVLVMLSALLVGNMPVLWLLSEMSLELPESFNVVLISQLNAIARQSRAFSITTIFTSLVFSAWSGMRGVRALISALNGVYREDEQRSFWQRQAVALGLCTLGGAFILFALTLIIGFGDREARLAAGSGLLGTLRWPLLSVALMLTLSAIYRHGPCRKTPQWRWVTWGATASAVLWLAGSLVLSYWVAHYQVLKPLLGSLTSVVLFLFWCYLTVLTILLGAHINAELERHTVVDTTSAGADGRSPRA